MTSPRGLHALARLHGIQTAYHDHDGRRVSASPEALMTVLRAMGVPVREAGDIPAALARRRRELWERAVEPVVVAWLPDPDPFTLRIPESLLGSVTRVTAVLEEGGRKDLVSDTATLPIRDRTALGGRTHLALEVPVPRVPAGYHELRVEVDDGSAERRYRALLIAAPRRAAGWETLPSTGWGVFAPLYALWEASVPDRLPRFALLDRLAEGVAALGGGVVGTLPLLSAFLDRPYDPSPYAPVSRLFWNELYVAVDEAGDGFGEGRRLDPRQAMAARRARLAEAAHRFYQEQDDDEASGPGSSALAPPPAMASFVARNPRVLDYARFRALTEARGPWPRWPDRLRAGDVRSDDYDRDAARYHLFAQWQAERQLAEAAERALDRGVALYLDLPLGVHPDGYDVWRERDQFATGVTVGAPPDPLAPGGQDWGFHPPHPERARLDGHRYFIASIRTHLRFAGVLRLDHIMQLHRMFWVPGTAAEGVYVRYPHEELYAILSLESHRAGAVIVGEDLGTVPRSVRRGMRRHGIPGMYVVQFSLKVADSADSGTADSADSGSRRPGDGEGEALVPGKVPAGSLASIGTHDTPMFAAWWTGRDAEIRAERDLMDPEEAASQVRGRRDLREKLARGLRGESEVDLEIDVPAESGLAAGDGGSQADSSHTAGDAGPLAGSSLAAEDTRSVLASGVAVQAALYRVLGRSRAGLVLASLEDAWMETEPQNVPGTPAEQNWRQRARHPLESVTEGVAGKLLTVLNDAREGRS